MSHRFDKNWRQTPFKNRNKINLLHVTMSIKIWATPPRCVMSIYWASSTRRTFFANLLDGLQEIPPKCGTFMLLLRKSESRSFLCLGFLSQLHSSGFNSNHSLICCLSQRVKWLEIYGTRKSKSVVTSKTAIPLLSKQVKMKQISTEKVLALSIE